jgi:hypothetical protein
LVHSSKLDGSLHLTELEARRHVHTAYVDADIKMPLLAAVETMTAEVTGSHWLIRHNARFAWKQSMSTFYLDDGVTSKRDLRSVSTIKSACKERKGLGLNIKVLESTLDGAEKIGELAYCFSRLKTLITTAVLVSVQDEGFVGAPTRVAS